MEKMKIINITDEEYEKMKSFDYDDELKEEKNIKGEEDGQQSI